MKKIILTEEQRKKLFNVINEEENVTKKGAPYTINPDKVLIVKRYLDNGFKRGTYEKIEQGFPKTDPVYAMLGSTGEVLQTLTRPKMVDLLISKYKNMFTDEIERELFLTRVLDDWYNNKIGIFGTLSVNHL